MKKRIHFLLPIGLVMIVFALFGLYSAPKIQQYAFQPEQTLLDVQESMADVRSELPDYTLTLHAVANGVALTTESEQMISDVVLYMVDTRYNECYPQKITSGRPLAYSDIADGEHALVLDEKLAFQLFGDRDPIDQKVEIRGKTYKVVGLAKHTRRIGEIGAYAAWIPISCADDDTTCDVAVVTAVDNGGGDMSVFLTSTVQTNLGVGTLYSLSKERMRSTMALRLMALVIVIRLLAKWIRLVMRLGAHWLADFRACLKESYMKTLAGYFTARALAMLALAAGTLAVCWGLMNVFIEPVLVFAEWIPEVLVSFSSIQGRFWELCAEAAKPISCMTAEMAELRFFAGFLRWGVIAMLIGLVMTLITPRAEQKN